MAAARWSGRGARDAQDSVSKKQWRGQISLRCQKTAPLSELVQRLDALYAGSRRHFLVLTSWLRDFGRDPCLRASQSNRSNEVRQSIVAMEEIALLQEAGDRVRGCIETVACSVTHRRKFSAVALKVGRGTT